MVSTRSQTHSSPSRSRCRIRNRVRSENARNIRSTEGMRVVANLIRLNEYSFRSCSSQFRPSTARRFAAHQGTGRHIALGRVAPPPLLARRTRLSQRRLSQAQRICNHGDRTQTHCRGSGHWAQKQPEERIEHGGGERDAAGVLDESGEKVLANIPHGGSAEDSGASDAPEITLNKCDPGALHGHVGAGSNGGADMCSGQRRGVVYAIARHGDDAALAESSGFGSTAWDTPRTKG